MEQVRAEMINAVEDIIGMIHPHAHHHDLELCERRLEVLAENALNYREIPLEIVNLLSQALNNLRKTMQTKRSYQPYAASLVHNERRPGRPRFEITEDQLIFFHGNIRAIHEISSIIRCRPAFL